MKTFYSDLLLIALLAASLPAMAADDYSVSGPSKTMFSSAGMLNAKFIYGYGTNSAGTYLTTNSFYVPGKELAIQCDIEAIAACDSNLVVTLTKSVDNVNWDTWQTLTVAANGATHVTMTTNYTSVSWPFVRSVVSGGGTAAKAFTNTYVRVFSK